MLSLRIDDRAFLRLIRKWLKAGILETDGQVIHPEIGTPQGGNMSPVLANVYLHYALDRWFENVVKPHCRGEALLCRFADDWVCAFRYQEDAERFYQVLPKRLEKFDLEWPRRRPVFCVSVVSIRAGNVGSPFWALNSIGTKTGKEYHVSSDGRRVGSCRRPVVVSRNGFRPTGICLGECSSNV
jgi:Reverse transcriptase (RNA-dependent DNA polymerase)